MPGIEIGLNALVAVEAVVTKNVSKGDIVAGVPARVIGKVDDLVAKMEKETSELPWADIIYQRQGSFDPKLEPCLTAARVKYFFGEER
ncbi:acetyltransferase (isoleucine patch superfamily) [Gynuella sunshinyii YC6258]|uniref:Acetyltransferase (Isoleucine patch superfamily) n=2 Tax=Gynuella sunshinyii TaxID=1445505 RepID=A0A0C5VRE7_9GAMM|nr:acetyltransferase (isoleucine patch superfamily) [Gynuella sunshinyii YC6258]